MEIIWFIVGAIVGCIVTTLVLRLTSVCTIVIDHSDPDTPYPFLEGKVPLDVLARNKYVTAKVEKRDYLSQN